MSCQKSIHAIAAFEECACFHKKHIQTVRSDFPQTLLANEIGSENTQIKVIRV